MAKASTTGNIEAPRVAGVGPASTSWFGWWFRYPSAPDCSADDLLSRSGRTTLDRTGGQRGRSRAGLPPHGRLMSRALLVDELSPVLLGRPFPRLRGGEECDGRGDYERAKHVHRGSGQCFASEIIRLAHALDERGETTLHPHGGHDHEKPERRERDR